MNDSLNGNVNLPKILETVHQEDKSINEFKRMISETRLFLVKEETSKDFGVDLRLELILNQNFASNIKIDVQIKDVKIARDFNNDGSYSYQIKISTLNYLLNSLNSLFIIYLEDKDIFLWEWCYKIRNYIRENNINLDKQNSIVYRFVEKLDEKSVKVIYDEVQTKYKKILIDDKFSKLNNIKQNSSDLNISVDASITKYNLKIIFGFLIKKKQYLVLSALTLYSVDELQYALENGIMTTRLAEGIKQIIKVDLHYLNGTSEVDEIFIYSLGDNYAE